MNDRSLDIDGPALLSVSDRVDLLCDSFEQALLQGLRPTIEELIVSAGDDSAGLLVELVQIEFEHRQRAGENPSVDEYLHRFSPYASILKDLNFKSQPGGRSRRREVPPAMDSRFEIFEQIGSGGFGTVWRARDSKLERIVAIKVPHANRLAEGKIDQFLLEAKAAAKLRHPNIIAVHDFGVAGEVAYIVYEYVAGPNLAQWTRRSVANPEEIARLGAKIARALHHAHLRGIVHRDLKPANLVLDDADEPHITDFGLAKYASPIVDPLGENCLAGTPAYMSPEQLRGSGVDVGPQADVYALGTILFELLTGIRPIEGAPGSLVRPLFTGSPYSSAPHRTPIPRDLETVCTKATADSVAERYCTAEDMAVDLERFLRGEPVSARRTTHIERMWRWAKSARRIIGIQAFLLVLALVALVVALTGGIENQRGSAKILRHAQLATNPPGATLVLVPLDSQTGELQPTQMVRPVERTPVELDLAPGDYLVIAALDGHRFHEVYRRIPENLSAPKGQFRHLRWKSDEHGRISLPPIDIPTSSVTDGMAFVGGSNTFQVGSETSSIVPAHSRAIASFLMDPWEVSVGEFVKVMGSTPADLNYVVRPNDHAVTVGYEAAVAAAELVGKRLPDEFEFEFLAARCNPPASDSDPTEFGPVGQPQHDRVDLNIPVFGLCSNVAEWTCSWSIPYPPHRNLLEPIDRHPLDYRIVRGGDMTVIKGNPTVSPTHRDPRARIGVSRGIKPGIGFRCVRSAQPRLTPADFPSSTGN